MGPGIVGHRKYLHEVAFEGAPKFFNGSGEADVVIVGGVVDQHVKPAMSFYYQFDGCAAFIRLSQLRRNKIRLPALRCPFVQQATRSARKPVDDDREGAFGHKCGGNGFANTAGSAGHDNNLAVKLQVDGGLPFRLGLSANDPASNPHGQANSHESSCPKDGRY